MAAASQEIKLAPIIDGAEQSNDDGFAAADDYEDEIAYSGCGCFQRFCLRWRGGINGGYGYLVRRQEEEIRESWVVRAVKKLKEVSEVLAGPKWKNFIRRFSVHGINKKRRMNFQYDPQSYALNFDEGMNKGGDEGFPAFSSRFAVTR
ncbi:hypothetical protein SLEP1_g15554 [Rubroshorea leprosula]|uniref:Uncharacterized protein n=1 Tax=Rubroshorea leprosula TaxID=152421 RepID=A0AAV5IWM2_9ROSI|nr:hypothetical protein SLEP1_g15554 [Rubroshorea leprosula]